jgi:hypothetical protein
MTLPLDKRGGVLIFSCGGVTPYVVVFTNKLSADIYCPLLRKGGAVYIGPLTCKDRSLFMPLLDEETEGKNSPVFYCESEGSPCWFHYPFCECNFLKLGAKA